MVADALKGDRIIGMTTLKPGYEADYRGRPPIYEIGCAGVITNFEELPDGRFNIELRGFVKFRVTGEDDSRLYRLARVDAMPEVLDEAERAALRPERQRLEALITKGGDSKVPPDTTDEQLVNMVAQYLPMGHAERQSLLELRNVLVRARALNTLIESKFAQPRAVRRYRAACSSPLSHQNENEPDQQLASLDELQRLFGLADVSPIILMMAGLKPGRYR